MLIDKSHTTPVHVTTESDVHDWDRESAVSSGSRSIKRIERERDDAILEAHTAHERISELEKLLADSEKIVSQRNRELAESKKQRDSCFEQLESLETRVYELQNQNKTLEELLILIANINAVADSMHDYQSHLSRKEQEFDEITNEMSIIREKMRQLHAERDFALESLRKNEETIAAFQPQLERQFAEHNERIAFLEKQLAEKELLLHEAQLRAESSPLPPVQQAETLATEIRYSQPVVTRNQDVQTERMQDLALVEAMFDMDAQDKRLLREDNDRLTNTLMQNARNLSKRNVQDIQMTATVDSLRQRIIQAETENSQLKKELEDQIATHQRIKNTVEDLRQIKVKKAIVREVIKCDRSVGTDEMPRPEPVSIPAYDMASASSYGQAQFQNLYAHRMQQATLAQQSQVLVPQEPVAVVQRRSLRSYLIPSFSVSWQYIAVCALGFVIHRQLVIALTDTQREFYLQTRMPGVIFI
eukprot:jgi/Hompol1/3136/HPOL_003181-RA